MVFLEKDLEQIIFDESKTKEGRKRLSERGLKIKGKLFRQVKIGAYGIADLVSIELVKGKWEDDLAITIYELKKDQINIDTLLQVSRYETGISRLIEEHYKEVGENYCLYIKSVMIGRTIETQSDFVFLLNKYIDEGELEVFTYDYGIDGLRFEQKYGVWHKTNECFDNMPFNYSELTLSDKKELFGALNS